MYKRCKTWLDVRTIYRFMILLNMSGVISVLLDNLEGDLNAFREAFLVREQFDQFVQPCITRVSYLQSK